MLSASHPPACSKQGRARTDPSKKCYIDNHQHVKVNFLNVAKAKLAQISALQKEHENICRQAVDCEKKALETEKNEAGAKDVTEETYRKLLEE